MSSRMSFLEDLDRGPGSFLPFTHLVRELEKPAFVTGDPEPGHA